MQFTAAPVLNDPGGHCSPAVDARPVELQPYPVEYDIGVLTTTEKENRHERTHPSSTCRAADIDAIDAIAASAALCLTYEHRRAIDDDRYAVIPCVPNRTESKSGR